MITRIFGETDADFQTRKARHSARSKLRNLLRKLGLKSARGIGVDFTGLRITYPPGVYTNEYVKEDSDG